MNLYLITQSENEGYDTYDSAVVAAKTARAAKRIHPAWGLSRDAWEISSTWASHPDKVEAKFLGRASVGTREGLILASFNAG